MRPSVLRFVSRGEQRAPPRSDRDHPYRPGTLVPSDALGDTDAGDAWRTAHETGRWALADGAWAYGSDPTPMNCGCR